MSFLRFLSPATLILTGLITSAGLASEPARVSPRSETLDLLFDTGDTPLRLELRVEVDERTVPDIWDESFRQLTAYYDRDGDGALNAREATRLPAPFALRQLLWGQVAAGAEANPPFSELDLDADGRVAATEVADWYRRAGLGNTLVGVGRPPSTERLTESLLRLVDANHDGIADESEWKAIATTLAGIDANDDELIGPGELVARITYPGALGTLQLRPPAGVSIANSIADSLPFIVLPQRLDDRLWTAAVVARRKSAAAPQISAEQLASIRQAPPTATWHIRFATIDKGHPGLSVHGAERGSRPRLSWSCGNTRFELRQDAGRLDERIAGARDRLSVLLTECDANANRVLDGEELQAPAAAPLKALIESADRDDDGRLSRDELNAWLTLQEQIARGQILLTVLDHGAGLFEVLDADHDGALSLRELRTSWSRLQEADCVANGVFRQERLPRQLLTTVSHGLPISPLGRNTTVAPDWFTSMDRNGDGDISRREFSGGGAVFEKLDTDGDGLLSSEEATAKAASPRK